ncbi:MAG: beta-ketoacyl-ACP synthase III [Desulfobacterales bacterium]
MIRSLLKSTGRYLPPRCVSNHELSKRMNTSDEWIRQRTGIETRYWVREGDDMSTSDLALEASRMALARAGWLATDLDLIVMATMTSDTYVPGAGTRLQRKLAATNIPALDIRQQCTGFLHGLELCDAYIKSGKAHRILLVRADFQSRFLALTNENRDTAVIFADGAGAACLEAQETDREIGILAAVFHADGRHADALRVGIPARKSGPIAHPEVLAQKEYLPYMDGRTVFIMAVTLLPEVVGELLEQSGLQLADIDMIIPHQANLRINEAFRDRMKLPKEKIYNNIQRYGNTTGGTIPIALDELMEQDRLKSRDNLMLIGLGAGITWGGVLYRMP